jgi:hypothetical protein
VGVHILPVLNPNPSGSQGAYTTSDLANISQSNWRSFYALQPNVDYRATTIVNNQSTATFDTDGQYFVQLVTSNGQTQKETLFHVLASDFFAEIPAKGAKDKGAPQRKIDAPKSDLIIVSDGDPDDIKKDGQGAMKNAQKQLPNAAKAKTLQEVKDAIKKYFDDHGMQKFSLTLIGHGAFGIIKIGTEYISDVGGDMTPSAFQAMIDQYVSSIDFYSCSVGAGPAGQKFLDDFAASLDSARAWNAPITIGMTYFDTDATGRLVSGVPEPSTLALLGIGTLGLFGSAWHRRKRAAA